MVTFFCKTLAQSLNRANELKGWQCCTYSAEGNTFALCAWPDRFLIFRGTRSVKLPFSVGGEFSVTEEAGLHKVLIRSRGEEFWIFCEDMTFYQTEPHVNIESVIGIETSSRATSNTRSQRRVFCEHPACTPWHQFPQFNGACLTWQDLGTPHMHFGLLATALPRGDAEIAFIYTEYVECPTEMHNVRLRLASGDDIERLPSHLRSGLIRGRLVPPQRVTLPPLDCLVIEHDGGVGYVAARYGSVRWVGEPGPLVAPSPS